MVRATNRPKVRRAVFRALVQASKNLGLYVAPEAAEHLERAKEAPWIPLGQLLELLELAAAPYPEPASVLERLGREMVDAWYQKEQGGELPKAVPELLGELGHGYHQLVRGDGTETGEVHLVTYEPDKGEIAVRSTTPFPRDLERGVLQGLLLRMHDVIGVEPERIRSPGEHRLRVWTHSAIEKMPFDEELVLKTSADEVRRLAHVGVDRCVEGPELFVLVERSREVKRELRRTQALVRTTTAALGQALDDRASQHRVLGKLVREYRGKTRELTGAQGELEAAKMRIETAETSARRLVDELCERLPGSQVMGRYDVKKRLGHGAASSVFDVFDQKLKDRATLRVLRSTNATQSSAILAQAERMQEARIPRVPAVRSATTLAGVVPCVVTEAVRGRSLRRVLMERGRLEEEMAATIVQGLLDVLAAAHASGFSHGAVRPESVVVNAEGALLLELELAPVTRELPRSAASRVYRAPESEGGALSPERDVFATGAILLELLTGDPPEEGIARRVPASRIGALCVTALDPNPKSRPRARELCDALASLSPPVSLAELTERARPSLVETATPAAVTLDSGVYRKGEAAEPAPGTPHVLRASRPPGKGHRR